MTGRTFARNLMAVILSGAAGTTVVSADNLPMSNKWRIEVSESAKSDGVIVLRVTPDGAAPIDVSVTIPEGRSENQVARHIQDSLGATLDKASYEVEMDDGEDILVKRMGGATFNVKLVEATVESVRIKLDEE